MMKEAIRQGIVAEGSLDGIIMMIRKWKGEQMTIYSNAMVKDRVKEVKVSSSTVELMAKEDRRRRKWQRNIRKSSC